jgi:hypothetical protein
MSGFWLSNWQWINLHHWFGNKNCYCLVIKKRPCNLNSLWGMWAFYCLTNNHCHIPWDGGVKFDLIVKYPKSTNQAYCFCVLSMERKLKVWSPWYLMLENKLGKVECKFCGNFISYYKDRMLFHLGYWYDGNGQTRVIMCSMA